MATIPAAVRSYLSPRNGFILLGVVLIATLVFVAGPMISIGGAFPLGNTGRQLLAVTLVPTGFLILMVVRQVWTRAINDRVTRALTAIPGGGAASGNEQAGAEAAKAGLEEVKLLAARFKEALAILKKRRLPGRQGRQWLYQLPWYLILGTPGSGKTTAIANSGLTFPLAESFGRNALGGVGGTRNCDWWFTDDAVLIDTAGRYTSQDSDEVADRTAWMGFLGLLARFRRHQPLNGILVAVGLSDVLTAGEQALAEQANQLRKRIGEIYEQLGLDLPVYLLFTKTDLIAGFVEYFDDLGREGREAVWGITFPLDEAGPPAAARYSEEFDLVVERLDERLVERVQQEGDIERRGRLFRFPQQIASLHSLTSNFVRQVFEHNSFDKPILLRGVYFTSGTQTGTPFDRIADAVAKSYGLDRRPIRVSRESERSYFLGRLFRDVVFGEAWLVGRHTRLKTRLEQFRRGSFVVIATIALAFLILWSIDYFKGRALIARVAAASQVYAGHARGMPLDHVSDDDVTTIVPLLDELRAMETGYTDQSRARHGFTFLQLDQRAKLGSQTVGLYRRALGAVLLPRILLHLEKEIAAHQSEPAFLYPALQVYLMLGHQGPLAAGTVRGWMQSDWAAAYPGSENDGLRAALDEHLQAMLSAPFATVPLNGALVDQTRTVLAKTPLAQRILSGIEASPQARQFPAWRPSDNVGPLGGLVMRRRSGLPLSAGVPGLYTHEGFMRVFEPALPSAIRATLARDWVVDPNAGSTRATGADMAQLKRDVTQLYLEEFALQWDQLIDDISIKPVQSSDDMLRELNVLSGPTSPIRLLVASAAKETSLGGGEAGASGLFNATGATTPAALAQSYTDQHFGSLHGLVQLPANSGPGAPLPIDGVIAEIGNLYRSVTTTAVGAGPLQQSSDNAGAVARLRAGASTLPEPVRSWVGGIGQASAKFSQADTRRQLATLWAGGPGPLCEQVTANRFPFVRSAVNEAPIGDFGRLFATGGAIDAFFAQNLGSAVDTAGPRWRLRDSSNTALGLNASNLAQFQRAGAIRDAMFAHGGNVPAIGFVVTILSTDLETRKVAIDIDGQRLRLQRGATPSMRMQWPAPNATGTASIGFGSSNHLGPLATHGAWALFRLLDMGSTGPQIDGQMRLRFADGNHYVEIGLRSDTATTPLTPNFLSQFRCPIAMHGAMA